MKANGLLVPLLIACMLVATAIGDAGAQDKKDAKIRPDLKVHGSKIIEITTDITKSLATEVVSGTTVVWFNLSNAIIDFEFTGKQVTLACAAPANFFVNDKGSFTSYKILPGATASLCFIEKGEYEYRLFLRPGRGLGPSAATREIEGKIIVK
jgi:hypothetical protein